MLNLFVILLILIINFISIRKELQEDKTERRWFMMLSVTGVSLAIVVQLELPLHSVMNFFNHTLGEVTKLVIKI